MLLTIRAQSNSRSSLYIVQVLLTPVANRNDAFWISGDSRGEYYEQKYYKVVFGDVTEEFRAGRPTKSGYGFDIQATGDYNAWSLMGEYRTMIKEAINDFKTKKEQVS